MVGSLPCIFPVSVVVAYTVFLRGEVNKHCFLQECALPWFTVGRGQGEVARGASTCLSPSYHNSLYYELGIS